MVVSTTQVRLIVFQRRLRKVWVDLLVKIARKGQFSARLAGQMTPCAAPVGGFKN